MYSENAAGSELEPGPPTDPATAADSAGSLIVRMIVRENVARVQVPHARHTPARRCESTAAAHADLDNTSARADIPKLSHSVSQVFHRLNRPAFRPWNTGRGAANAVQRFAASGRTESPDPRCHRFSTGGCEESLLPGTGASGGSAYRSRIEVYSVFYVPSTRRASPPERRRHTLWKTPVSLWRALPRAE